MGVTKPREHWIVPTPMAYKVAVNHIVLTKEKEGWNLNNKPSRDKITIERKFNNSNRASEHKRLSIRNCANKWNTKRDCFVLQLYIYIRVFTRPKLWNSKRFSFSSYAIPKGDACTSIKYWSFLQGKPW